MQYVNKSVVTLSHRLKIFIHHSQFDDDHHVHGCWAILDYTSIFIDVTNKTLKMANESNTITTYKRGH